MVSCQREYGPALCNETAHTWALLQQLRHAASLRRLQQSCCSCTLCLLIILPQQPTSFSSETLLLLPQRWTWWRMPTPQAQGASRTLALLSCTHPQFLFSSLCCIKAGTGMSQSPPNTTQHIQTTDCSQDQSQPHRTSRNKLWVLLVRKESSTCCAKATKGFVSVMYNTRCLGLEQPEGSHSQHRYFTSTLIFAPFQ